MFIESITTILALIDSLAIGDLGDDLPYYMQPSSNPYFILSIMLSVGVNLSVFIIYMLYKFVW